MPRWLNVANSLTVLRLLLVPFIVHAVLTGQHRLALGLLLGAVHGLIGALDELLGADRLVLRARDTNARTELDAPAREWSAHPQRIAEPLRDAHGDLDPRDAAKQHDELVTSKASDQVLVPVCSAKSLRDEDQRLIPG